MLSTLRKSTRDGDFGSFKLKEGTVHPLMIPDIATRILTHLGWNDLLSCRQVCCDWKETIERNEFLSKCDGSKWNILVDPDDEGDLKSFRRIKGTRFSTRRDVALFLLHSEKCQEGYNPFPNRVVIFDPVDFMNSAALMEYYESVRVLSSSKFSKEITSLAINVIVRQEKDVQEYRKRLSGIFLLSNLKSLTVHAADWNWLTPTSFRKRPKQDNNESSVLSQLDELKIIGNCGLFPVIDLLSEKEYRTQIKRLMYVGHTNLRPIEMPWASWPLWFKNLEQIKIIQPCNYESIELKGDLAQFKTPLFVQPSLFLPMRTFHQVVPLHEICLESKETQLCFSQISYTFDGFEGCFDVLYIHAIHEEGEGDDHKKCPYVATLGLPYDFVKRCRDYHMSEALGKKFPQLEQLLIFNWMDVGKQKKTREAKFTSFCNPLWSVFSSTLKSISQPDYGLVANRP